MSFKINLICSIEHRTLILRSLNYSTLMSKSFPHPQIHLKSPSQLQYNQLYQLSTEMDWKIFNETQTNHFNYLRTLRM